MSTDYITKTSKTVEAFIKEAEGLGWHFHKVEDLGTCLKNARGDHAWVYQAGERVQVSRYGGNRVESLVDPMDMISEYEDAYWDYMGRDED